VPLGRCAVPVPLAPPLRGVVAMIGLDWIGCGCCCGLPPLRWQLVIGSTDGYGNSLPLLSKPFGKIAGECGCGI